MPSPTTPDGRQDPTAAGPIDRPWLTVLFPTYNRGSFIGFAVERLARQVEARGWDVQVVVSDNGSLDGTPEILAELRERFPRLEIVRPPVHVPSAEGNMAFALDLCRGEHVWVLGDDDYVLDDALARIEALLAQHGFDFFLFNNRIFYAPDRVAPPMIPMIGTLQVCPISEIIARVGFMTIAASISSAVVRSASLRAGLRDMVGVSPYFAHVAAYLHVFRDGRCGFGGESIALIREAASAPVTFAEVMALSNVRSAGPWGFGIAALVGRLLDLGAIDDGFVPSVVELGHDRRYTLLGYALVHCLKQIRAWARTGSPGEAVTPADLAALQRMCGGCGVETRETVTRIAEIVAVLRAVHASPEGAPASSPFGPGLPRLIETLGRRGAAVRDAVAAWVERETEILEAPLQATLVVGRESRPVGEHGDHVLLRRGLDVVAIRRDILGQVGRYCDLDVVNPVGNAPWVLIDRSIGALTVRIDGAGAEPERFLSHTILRAQGGALALPPVEIDGSRVVVARDVATLREAIAFAGRGDAPEPARAATLASLETTHRDLFDATWYAAQYGLALTGDRAQARRRALDHFIRTGLAKGHSPSVWFDEAWYCERWFGSRDAVRRGRFSGGLDHFLREGAARLLSPSPHLDLGWYLARSPDAQPRIEAGTSCDALQDYLTVGARQGAGLNPNFDEGWYRGQHPGLAARIASGEFLSGLHHYLVEGRAQGFDPGPGFSEAAYREANPDVAAGIEQGQVQSGLDHWLRHGRAEGRRLHAGKAGRPDIAPSVWLG